MREVELKLAVDDPFVTPALRPEGVDMAGMEELPALDLRATYYDTPDLRLARHGVTLRYRTGEGDRSGWSLKLPVLGQDAATRDELPFEGTAGKVPRAARDLVTAFARSAPLAPVARLRTQRRRWCLRGSDGKELAELVDDRVSVTKEGRVVERFRELEVESRGLDRPALERIAVMLQEAGASAPRPVPKIVRALGSKATLPPDVVAPARVSPLDPAAYAVQAAIARGVRRILANDPGARLGDAEPVHQMRVGARRLRSDLRTFAPLVDSDWADRLRVELRWLAEALGQVRDLDVMQARLRAAAHDLDPAVKPLFGHMDEQHLVARAGLLQALRSPRYVDLLERLIEAARSPALTRSAWEPSEKVLPPLAARAWRRLAREGRALDPAKPDEHFHRVRILAKRSRYAAEAVAPALGSKRGKLAARFARRVADVQEVLGTLQDSVVARELIGDLARARASDGPFNLAAGRLLERQDQSGRESRAAFFVAWRRLDRRKHERWFEQ
jgi:CHAD domain-containing protein